MAKEIDSDAIRAIAKSIQDLSRMDMFPRTSEDRNLEVLAKKMDDLEKGNRSNTKKMIESYDKSMKDHGISKEIKDLKSVLEVKDQHKAMKSILSVLTKVDDNDNKIAFETKRETDQTLLKMSRDAESAGTTLEEMGIKATGFYNRHIKKWQIKVEDQIKVTSKLAKETNKLGDAMEEAAHDTEKYSEKVSFVKDVLGKFGNVAKTVGKDFLRLAEQEQRYAQQNAVADAGWIDGVTKMQISTLDYMKILKDTRRESLAANAAGIDFKKSLIDGTDSLRSLTSSSTEAAMVSKSFHKNMARIGVSQDDLGGAVLEQTQMYKEHYRVLGYSADEFANLTAELINDQGMRSTLLNLQEKERKAYIMGVQQRQAEYQTMGYTIERAKELQKTFQALNKMSPKDRMKQAAKTRAMMGSMGMGAEGAELFDLQTRYRTMGEEEKGKADIRMTQIQSQAAGKFGEMSGAGSSLGQSMAMQMMAEKTGFVGIADTFETASGEGLKVDAKQLAALKEQAASSNEISKTSSALLHTQDAWRAASETALTSIGTNLIGGFANLALVNTAGFAATAAASSGAFGGKGGGVGGPSTQKMSMKGGLGVLAAAGIGWEIGSAITDMWKTSDPSGYAEASMDFGKMIDNTLAVMGSEAAEERLAINARTESRKVIVEELQKEGLSLQAAQLEASKQLLQEAKEARVADDKKIEIQQKQMDDAKAAAYKNLGRPMT